MLKPIKPVCFVISLLILMCCASTAVAGTYTAATCSRADVDALINGPTHTAIDGDVIQVPAGSCTWTNGITVPVGIGITIRGSGTPNGSSTTTGPSASCVATAITDNLTAGGYMFFMQPTYGGGTTRLSCMKILGDSGLAVDAIAPPVAFSGTCSASTCGTIRMDNVTFDISLQDKIVVSDSATVTDNVFGVMDHNSLTASYSARFFEFINFNNSAWNGVGAYGDNSWASASSFGTAKVLYLENNDWNGAVIAAETEGGVNGSQGGGRIVARFNNCTDCWSLIAVHGTESNGRPRGGRQFEAYGNNFKCGNTSGGCQAMVGIRSGTAYMFGNSLTVAAGAWFNEYLVFSTYRTLTTFGVWGVCDGTGPYDNNDGIVYASGTITSAASSGVTITVTDNTKTWTANQWIPSGAPYAIHDVTGNVGAGITQNGLNTIGADGWTVPPPFVVGDSYQILRASACIDQPNRSGGTLLSGSTPSPTGPVNQSLDPSYEWNNSGTAPVFSDINGGLGMLSNRDWYTDNSSGSPHAQTSPTSPFNATSGVGFGTLANRPSTCTAGVGYWATDQGSWNTSGNGFGEGQLSICASTNTWALSYTPYSYPHPLTVSGVVSFLSGNVVIKGAAIK